MKLSYKTSILLSTAVAALMLCGCTKSNNSEVAPTAANDNVAVHNYGLLPMQPEQWANVPVFSQSVISGKIGLFGLSASSLPNSYLLASPAIRDQGQIGSCTGFCGAETGEILYYYKNDGSVSSANFATDSKLTASIGQAITNQVVSAPTLSPLFLYYVERCVILKQSITTDKGAYMVNIPETYQGLTSNSGTGAALTLNGTTFAGVCYETDYPYPSNGSNTSTQFKTPPSGNALTNDQLYTIGAQNGATGSSGTTTEGYYVINSSDPVIDVKTALANNKPVMMGFNVYDNSRYQYFEGLGTTSYTYNPLASSGRLAQGVHLLGGHAVPIIGYINDSTQPGGGVFICQNSWSTSWGYHGYFYLPYSVLRSTTVVPAGNLYVAII
jgi:hypothetical protein